MSVLHPKNIYRIMKRGYHLLESIFDPKTQLKTIVPLGMEVQLVMNKTIVMLGTG